MFVRKLRAFVRRSLLHVRYFYLRYIWGHRIHPSTRVSFKAFLDKSHPSGIVVGEHTIITRQATILSHDYCRGLYLETVIGSNCLIGTQAIVLPGVRIGNQCVVGAGAVVTRDVPSGSLVAGNPARIIASINAGPYGYITPSDASRRSLSEDVLNCDIGQ